jgi:hypothetical protein
MPIRHAICWESFHGVLGRATAVGGKLHEQNQIATFYIEDVVKGINHA